MRNLKLSIFVIVITIFTVITMSIDLDFFTKRKGIEITDEIAQTTPLKASDEKNFSDEKEAKQEEKEDSIEQQVEPNQEEEDEHKVVQEIEKNHGEEEQNYNILPIEKPDRVADDDAETAQVFKVDKTTITDKLSFEEKRKLLSIAMKLSMIDYANIVDTMQSSEEMKSASHIFGILKLRLDSEDYEQLIEILDPYLYIDNIESNISS